MGKKEEDQKMNNKRYLQTAAIIILIIALGEIPLQPCTVAVVSGKATPDGRPLLWKNRDTNILDNKVVYFSTGKYRFLGVINVNDRHAGNVWQGLNSRGFALMNSLSSDLASRSQGYLGNGSFIKKALGECANVNEFEQLLLATNDKRRTAANYGAIDALGNAVFFETSGDAFVKFDANDPRFAPEGYIVRTNYAFSAPKKHTGGGYIRFERVSHLFARAAAEGRLNHRFILQEAARDLANEKLHSYPLRSCPVSTDSDAPIYIRTNDTLNRASTVSVAVFHGAPSPEKAYLATMWSILGQPVASAAVPMWVAAATVPEVLGGESTAPLNDLAKALTAYLYPDQRANMRQYLSLTRLLNYNDTGFLPLLLELENSVLAAAAGKMQAWESARPTQQQVALFMQKTAASIYRGLQTSFADILE